MRNRWNENRTLLTYTWDTTALHPVDILTQNVFTVPSTFYGFGDKVSQLLQGVNSSNKTPKGSGSRDSGGSTTNTWDLFGVLNYWLMALAVF